MWAALADERRTAHELLIKLVDCLVDVVFDVVDVAGDVVQVFCCVADSAACCCYAISLISLL